MIDARIPLMGRGLDMQQIMANAQQQRANQQQMDGKRRLADLLPRAAQGDQAAIDEMAGINPELFLRMDERQKSQVAERTKDLTAAVRWADSPDKWEQVIDHYAQEGVDLSQYRGRFQDREKAMLQLGKIGEYLGSAPKRDLMQIDGVAIDKATGEPQFESPYDRIIPGPNGSFYRVPRIGIGRGGMHTPGIGDGVQAGGQVPPPPPGFVIDGGPTPQASGGFPR